MLSKTTKSIPLLIVVLILVSLAPGANGATVTELQNKISDRNEKIKALEQEIAQYEKNISTTQTQAKTLSSTIKQLDSTAKKLSSQISVTENKILSAIDTIEKLSLEIAIKENTIDRNLIGLTKLVQDLYAESEETMIEKMLSGSSIANAFNEVENLERIQAGTQDYIDNVRRSKNDLESRVLELEENKNKLSKLKIELADQKEIAENNKKEKSVLLTETKNKEENYKQLLADRKRQKEEFEKELRDFESQLKVVIDPNSLPTPGNAVLSWPLDNLRITQQFGNTAFAQANSAVYNGRGHNGIDLAASVGTPVKSAGNGTVMGVGDTDLGCPGGSYGKWVLIRHNNGLSTLYAHLSLIKISNGTQVERGSIIGYSGNTGYSTGPHLHFTVYATEGVRIDRLTRSDGSPSKCPAMPISPYNGYINPLLYLPNTN